MGTLKLFKKANHMKIVLKNVLTKYISLRSMYFETLD